MDTTDPDITFNDRGECHYVTHYRERLRQIWNPDGDAAAFEALVARIREEGRGREYDSILGLSGGVDSSYLAYLAWQNGLRPLVVHTDTGWNSELAVKNIENIVKRCKFDLYTHVVDWPEMQDVQRAFFRSAVPNQDIPQDHAIFAAFYGLAAKHRIKWVLNGSNFACESILPPAWGYDAGDLYHIRAIHRRFGERPMRRFPSMGYGRYALQFRLLHRLNVVKPLNLVRYRKDEAIRTLSAEFGWRYYGGKHYESRFTKFFQGWYLPTKFGFDKRLAHLSSLILNGEMTREQALVEMKREHYPAEELREDMVYMQKKLGVSPGEFARLMELPPQAHEKYPNSQWLLRVLKKIRRIWRP
ncbi:MAG: N-acetyl sugar amidotransferase [Opitutae bacterium]|nr:N-acetyl sugar amidotransferase [Opitutae bacterium]